MTLSDLYHPSIVLKMTTLNSKGYIYTLHYFPFHFEVLELKCHNVIRQTLPYSDFSGAKSYIRLNALSWDGEAYTIEVKVVLRSESAKNSHQGVKL